MINLHIKHYDYSLENLILQYMKFLYMTNTFLKRQDKLNGYLFKILQLYLYNLYL